MKKVKEISENEVRIDGSLYRKVEEPKPEFKVGDWVIAKKRYELEPEFFPIFRIEEVSNQNEFWLRPQVGKTTGTMAECCRYATPQEIESHLRKICDEKGFKEGVRFRKPWNNETGVCGSNITYLLDQDVLTYSDKYPGDIYKEGEFAEIISEKKRLPKTKEELKKAFNDYFLGEKNFKDFLEDYED